MVLAPIDIRPTRLAGTIEHMRRADGIEDGFDSSTVFHAHARGVDTTAGLGFVEQGFEVAGYPAVAAPDEESVGLRGGGGGGGEAWHGVLLMAEIDVDAVI